MKYNLENLNELRPDLMEIWKNLSKEELLIEIQKEVVDGLNMEERVSLFMEECTPNFGKTTYTLDSLRILINERKNQDKIQFCEILIDDALSTYESESGENQIKSTFIKDYVFNEVADIIEDEELEFKIYDYRKV